MYWISETLQKEDLDQLNAGQLIVLEACPDTSWSMSSRWPAGVFRTELSHGVCSHWHPSVSHVGTFLVRTKGLFVPLALVQDRKILAYTPTKDPGEIRWNQYKSVLKTVSSCYTGIVHWCPLHMWQNRWRNTEISCASLRIMFPSSCAVRRLHVLFRGGVAKDLWVQYSYRFLNVYVYTIFYGALDILYRNI